MKKKNKNKQVKTSRKQCKFLHLIWSKFSFVIDFIVLSICVIFLVLELNKKLCNEIEFNSTALTIICALLPSVITVVSISLQIQNDKVLGVSIRNLLVLREDLHYGLLHMIIVAIAALSFELVAQLLSCNITALLIAALSIFLSLIISIAEIPLLMKSEKAASRIISNTLVGFYTSKDKSNKQLKVEIKNSILGFLFVERGVKSTFYSLKGRKTDGQSLLGVLLSEQTSYYFELVEKTKIYNNNPGIASSFDCDVPTAINSGYKNLTELMDLSDAFNYYLFDKNGKETYHITRLAYALHRLGSELGLKEEEERSNYYTIFANYFFDIEGSNQSTLYNNFLVSMACSSLSNGEVWFIKMIRDFDYSPLFYDPDKYVLIYFLTMYCCFVRNSIYTNEEKSKNIEAFLTEKSKGLNSDGISWIEKVKRSIENHNNPNKLVEVLEKLLRLYEQIRDHSCDITPKYMSVYNYDDSTHFGRGIIIDYWLQILLYHPYFYYDTDECKKFFGGLDMDIKRDIVRCIEGRWLEDDRLKDNKKLVFFDFLFGDKRESNNEPERELFEILKRLRNDVSEETYNQDFKDYNEDTIRSIKQKVDDEMPRIIERFNPDGSVALDKEQNLYFNLKLEGDNPLALLDMYLKHIDDALSNIIFERIDKCIKKPLLFKDYRFSKEDINKIIKFKPDYSGQSSHLFYSCDDKQREIVRNMKIEKLFYLPSNTFIKKGGVLVNIEYSKDKTIPRMPTNDELEKIIDNEYTETNGLYRFSNYKTYIGSFLVTRDHLKELLSKRIILMPIVFKIKVVVNNKLIKYFKKAEKD